ncbi:MAG: hypothetical protein QE271_12665 [Bacteriovoracaceae bacterium]|nr:hypothetical protein [Bacteriovoracaceae bacterium]
MNKFIYFFLFHFLLVDVFSAAPNCEQIAAMQDEDLLRKQFLGKEAFYPGICFNNDPVFRSAQRALRGTYEIINELDGLPTSLKKKWKKLNHSQVMIVPVDFKLYFSGQTTELVAKNFHKKKWGLILINRSQWEQLQLNEQFALMWHEVLGVLHFEVNNYDYSSMVLWRIEGNVSGDSKNFTSEWHVVATLLDPHFLHRH